MLTIVALGIGFLSTTPFVVAIFGPDRSFDTVMSNEENKQKRKGLLIAEPTVARLPKDMVEVGVDDDSRKTSGSCLWQLTRPIRTITGLLYKRDDVLIIRQNTNLNHEQILGIVASDNFTDDYMDLKSKVPDEEFDFVAHNKSQRARRRRPRVITRYLLRAKAKFGCPKQCKANRLAVWRYTFDSMRQDNMTYADIHKYLPEIVAMVFVPSNFEIAASRLHLEPSVMARKRLFISDDEQ